jgi:hypothetical protein
MANGTYDEKPVSVGEARQEEREAIIIIEDIQVVKLMGS